jgi:hypothetical protein
VVDTNFRKSYVDESSFQSVMQAYDFQCVGTLQLSAGRFRYALTNDMSGEGFVYLWVERQALVYRIVYVGMAGKSLRARCEQHLGGFRQSTTGKAHAKRVEAGFSTGCEFLLYARRCGTGNVLDEADIPMTTVEELAFIRKFRPAWNHASSGISLPTVATQGK